MPHPYVKSTTNIDEKFGYNVIFRNISLTQTLEINTNKRLTCNLIKTIKQNHM